MVSTNSEAGQTVRDGTGRPFRNSNVARDSLDSEIAAGKLELSGAENALLRFLVAHALYNPADKAYYGFLPEKNLNQTTIAKLLSVTDRTVRDTTKSLKSKKLVSTFKRPKVSGGRLPDRIRVDWLLPEREISSGWEAEPAVASSSEPANSSGYEGVESSGSEGADSSGSIYKERRGSKKRFVEEDLVEEAETTTTPTSTRITRTRGVPVHATVGGLTNGVDGQGESQSPLQSSPVGISTNEAPTPTRTGVLDFPAHAVGVSPVEGEDVSVRGSSPARAATQPQPVDELPDEHQADSATARLAVMPELPSDGPTVQAVLHEVLPNDGVPYTFLPKEALGRAVGIWYTTMPKRLYKGQPAGTGASKAKYLRIDQAAYDELFEAA